MRLSELTGLDIPEHIADIEINGVTADSRTCQPGDIYVAIKGTVSDGADYIPNAVEKGAVAIIGVEKALECSVPYISHDNPRAALGHIAAALSGGSPEHIAAVTGTNGKTSVACFVSQILNGIEVPCGTMGTLGAFTAKGSRIGKEGVSLTTPDPVLLHTILASFVQEGMEYVAMEASSHGLDQERLAGVEIEVGAFTNLSRDHLDYHQDYEDYLSAKLRLFTDVMGKEKTVVINADIPEYEVIHAACERAGHRIIEYGHQGKDIKIVEITPTSHGQTVTYEIEGTSYTTELPLLGAFQVSNVLCALGMVWAFGFDIEKLIAVLPTLRTAEGRMQHVGSYNGADIIVDFAHTPDALEQVLKTVRPHVKGTLSLVFGCGGDRDQGKRSEMGEVAKVYADHVVVTDDNPRNESPSDIRKAILAECPKAQEIGDRNHAIEQAMANLREGDMLVVAGKGHEKTQTIQGKIIPCDDVAIVQSVIGAS